MSGLEVFVIPRLLGLTYNNKIFTIQLHFFLCAEQCDQMARLLLVTLVAKDIFQFNRISFIHPRRRRTSSYVMPQKISQSNIHKRSLKRQWNIRVQIWEGNQVGVETNVLAMEHFNTSSRWRFDQCRHYLVSLPCYPAKLYFAYNLKPEIYSTKLSQKSVITKRLRSPSGPLCSKLSMNEIQNWLPQLQGQQFQVQLTAHGVAIGRCHSYLAATFAKLKLFLT